jgi:hypothetical protein
MPAGNGESYCAASTLTGRLDDRSEEALSLGERDALGAAIGGVITDGRRRA